MSETALTIEFGDARYRFWLPMARIVELERVCGDKSILTIEHEMSMALGAIPGMDDPVFLGGGSARIRDIYEVIRCAAIGGGQREANGQTTTVSALDAKRLADGYVDGRPIAETLPVAWAILNCAIRGVQLKKNIDNLTEAADRNPS